MNKANNYNNDTIVSLSDKEAMRLRPSSNLGSDDINGVFHALKEVVDNSIDEVKAGFGDVVVIKKEKDNFYTVQDSGRGVPMDWNTREEKYNYELVFMTLNAGGKYNTEEDGTFEFPKGLNGIGAAAVAFTSEQFKAVSYRDGQRFELRLNKGELESFDKKESLYEYNGTLIQWKPDLEVFKEVDIPFEWIVDFAKEQAVVNKQTKMVVINEETGEKHEFYYENGIYDYLLELSEEGSLTTPKYWEVDAKGRDREDLPEYRARFQVAFVFNNDVNLLDSYHNSSYLKHGGSPHDAVKSAFSYAIHQYARNNNLYKKKEKRITWEDIQDSLIIVTNTYSMETSYANQTKLAITNEFVKDYMNEWLRDKLEVYFTENPQEAKLIAEQALINKRSSEKAEASRTAIRKKLSKKVNNLTGRIEKFVNCRSKKVEERELFIAEGDSALGSLRLARDPNTQALYALRGKILNTMKAPIDRILKNDIITDLLRIIDTGIEVKGNNSKSLNTFDLDKLKWNKIILTADQDVDGGHINTLVLTLFYTLMPQLLEQGKVYIALSPLYELVYKDESIFAYSEEEKDELLEKHGRNCIIQRSKGLGENTAEVMHETVMNPETRNLLKVTMENYDEVQEIFLQLMGDDIQSRKEIVTEYLKDYVEEID